MACLTLASEGRKCLFRSSAEDRAGVRLHPQVLESLNVRVEKDTVRNLRPREGRCSYICAYFLVANKNFCHLILHSGTFMVPCDVFIKKEVEIAE